jgi:hypothetical protein
MSFVVKSAELYHEYIQTRNYRIDPALHPGRGPLPYRSRFTGGVTVWITCRDATGVSRNATLHISTLVRALDMSSNIEDAFQVAPGETNTVYTLFANHCAVSKWIDPETGRDYDYDGDDELGDDAMSAWRESVWHPYAPIYKGADQRRLAEAFASADLGAPDFGSIARCLMLFNIVNGATLKTSVSDGDMECSSTHELDPAEYALIAAKMTGELMLAHPVQ